MPHDPELRVAHYPVVDAAAIKDDWAMHVNEILGSGAQARDPDSRYGFLTARSSRTGGSAWRSRKSRKEFTRRRTRRVTSCDPANRCARSEFIRPNTDGSMVQAPHWPHDGPTTVLTTAPTIVIRSPVDLHRLLIGHLAALTRLVELVCQRLMCRCHR